MSLLKRIGLVIRSYMADAGGRLDRVAAEEELRQSRARVRPEVASSQAAPVQSPQSTQLVSDYRFLGLEPGVGLAAVESAWRKLASRADPKRFPAGSEEEKQAAQILKSLNDSYSRLREALNPTEGRFGQLEL
jgi:hypothetical protein